MTISSPTIALKAWSLLLSQRQDFLNNHLARVPVTPNLEGTMEMRGVVLSGVGAQDMDTSECQVSTLDDVELYWKNEQLDVGAVFRPGIDAPFSPSNINDFETDSMAGNPLLIDEEHDKDISPGHHLTPPLSERSTQPPVLMKGPHMEQELKMFPILFKEIYLNKLKYCYCLCFIVNYEPRQKIEWDTKAKSKVIVLEISSTRSLA